MAVEFRLPDLGENIEAGEVLNVLVSEGQMLAQDEPVIELETDKAVIEVPSSVSGTIVSIDVGKGDRAAVGQVILTVEADGEGAEPAATETAPAPSAAEAAPAPEPTAPAPPPPAPASAEPALAELRLPELGEGIQSGEVVAILVAAGDQIEVDQGLIEVEIDKGVVEMPSTEAGTVQEIHVAKGDKASTDQLIVTVATVAPAGAPAAPPPAPAAPTPAPAPSAPPASAAAIPSTTAAGAPGTAASLVPASPTVRRLAREIGIDITQVVGRGPGGRVSEEDVKAHAKALNEGRSSIPASAIAAAPLPDLSKWGDIERQPMSNVRRLTAEHVSRAWGTIPHVTQFDKADVTQLEVWRKESAAKAEKVGGKLTPTAIILKIAASALTKFPQFNTSLDVAASELIYKKYCHIGIAVETKRGLLVPVVRDVDRKNVIDLSVELTELAEKTRTGKLGIDQMQGGCFTISNLGGIGGSGFTPIVNAPEVAILGVARSRQEPVLVDGQFEPRTMMPLSLSYDHRVIDGADGARFLRWICEALENPFLVMLEG